MMVLTGFMFNYMLRVNLTIAIVAMVNPTNKTVELDNGTSVYHHSYECYTPDESEMLHYLDNATSDATSKPPVTIYTCSQMIYFNFKQIRLFV